MGQTFKPIISPGVPESARRLFWEVFFASRGRGIDLNAHFPWISCTQNIFCVEIRNPSGTGEALAALVVRELRVGLDACAGLIGLVCVDEAWRGKGLASGLMSSAIELGVSRNMTALILWTQKPEVYAGQGFVIDQQDRFGYVESAPEQRIKMVYATHDWPGSDVGETKRGIPPFASRGQVISSDRASIVVFSVKEGWSVAEWAGEKKDIVDLMMASLPGRYSLNLAEGDSLISELEERGLGLDLRPSAVRMVKHLGDGVPVKLPTIKFLDRI
ncbi:N-acetyltransferase [Pseudomonas palleroniana]|nr:GNAT family N-acetyltransferase [Pseudomonas palleroniana]PTC31801.1 N-acetyltransferase [Pseudomonas palleroniana]SEE12889.1 Acetyltransferase (GNAT) family protein [Pseudomonas palleroniana]